MAGITGVTRRGKRGTIKFEVAKAELNRVVNNLFRLSKGVRKQTLEALEKESNNILEAAKKLTPVDTSRLQQSGRVLKPRKNAKNPEFTVIFGGIKVRGKFVDYAGVVHERTEIRHRIGQAKYLSTAFNRFLPGMAARIKANVNLNKIPIVKGRTR